MLKRLLLLVVVLGAGCEDKIPTSLKDTESVARTGELVSVHDTNFTVLHRTQRSEAEIFKQYATALEAKGWTLAREAPKPHVDPPTHNGCFERGRDQLSVGAYRHKPTVISVMVATDCLGI